VAWDTWTPPVKPQLGSALEYDERIDEASFGDGYRQISGAGLNAQFETWRLAWNGITNANADTIETFYLSKGRSTPFLYKMPGRSTTKQYRFASALSRRQLTGEADAIEVTIEQSFENN
jgi:phage-related protein